MTQYNNPYLKEINNETNNKLTRALNNILVTYFGRAP